MWLSSISGKIRYPIVKEVWTNDSGGGNGRIKAAWTTADRGDNGGGDDGGGGGDSSYNVLDNQNIVSFHKEKPLLTTPS